MSKELNIEEIVSSNIKKYRKLKGMTQSQLAEIIGCEKNSVQRWENGIYPRPQNIKELAKALKIGQTELFRGPENYEDEMDKAFHTLATNLGYEIKGRSK